MAKSGQQAAVASRPSGTFASSSAARAAAESGLPLLQRALGNQAMSTLLSSSAVRAKSRGADNDPFEQEADRVSAEVVGALGNRGGADEGPLPTLESERRVQRKCTECEEEEGETVRKSARDEAAAPEADRPAETSWLAPDDATDVAAGQMSKAQFLAELRAAVCATADEGMAGSGQTTESCPWISYWFAQAEGRDAAYVEGAIRKFAPETGRVASARDAIPIAAARVRRSVDQWARSGQIEDLPAGVTPDIPGMDLAGGVASMLFQARPGGARPTLDPADIRHQLGAGEPFDGAARSRMESAFGVSFGGVRLHTGDRAAELSHAMNARAFTIGRDVAFAAGEYQPGTLVGDALLAHELAHVVQQGGATPEGPQMKGVSDDRALEQDADSAAAGALASLFARPLGPLALLKGAAPRARSGLRLSRCSGGAPQRPPVTSALASAERGMSVCRGSAVRIEVRKSRDLSPSFTTRALDSLMAASGCEIYVPQSATRVTQHEDLECTLTWSCDGRSGRHSATHVIDWDHPPNDVNGQKVVTDAHAYGLAHMPGSAVRQEAEQQGFNMDSNRCSWEFVEHYRATTDVFDGTNVLHRCQWGFVFRATQRAASGSGRPAREAAVNYWGVDREFFQ